MNKIIEKVENGIYYLANSTKLNFVEYLQPIYTHQKSFYGKAKIYKDSKGRIYLMSYATIVAIIYDGVLYDDQIARAKVNGWYSRTTANHINDFLSQYGFKTFTKKQLEDIADKNKTIIKGE